MLIRKLDEGIRRYERNYISIPFGFYKPDEINVIEKYLGNTIPYSIFGGYPESLKKYLVIGEIEDENEYISCMCAKFNPKFNNLTHPDVAGAVFNLGIDDDTFGDFWVEEDKIYIYVSKEIASFIEFELTGISRVTVKFGECEFKDQTFKFQTMKYNVSSLRLDTVVSAIIRKSREKAHDLIVSSRVNVNYQTIEDCSFVCDNNDILSLRGFGRFKIDEISTNPRSGRINLTVSKFM